MRIINYIQYIPAIPKREMILARLGYKKNVTVLDYNDEKQLEAGIKEGFIHCKPQGVYCYLDIIANNGKTVKFENDIEITSVKLADLLKNSVKAVFMFATVGWEVLEKITSDMVSGNASLGVVLDSVASQTADAAVEWMVVFLMRIFGMEGEKLTVHRYSPGYGDLPLSYQKVIYEILELDRLGIRLTENYMLEPEKSVIAISGIERISDYG